MTMMPCDRLFLLGLVGAYEKPVPPEYLDHGVFCFMKKSEEE
tara:strand:+ start:120 stop:245 length:126 start_codon:yes stop_codon:yes gene_type:complete